MTLHISSTVLFPQGFEALATLRTASAPQVRCQLWPNWELQTKRKHTATRVLLQLQARSTTNQIDVWWTNDIGVKIHLRLFLAANPATSSPAFCEKVLKTLPNASQEKYQTNRLYNSHDFSKSRQRQCTQKGMLSSQARTRRSRRTSPCLPSLLAWSKRSLDAFYV